MEISTLLRTMPQTGTIKWMSYRTHKHVPVTIAETLTIDPEEGIVGDHYQGKSGNRQVTIIQQEHLQAIASILAKEIDPALTRRNLVVSGINLLALKDRTFRIGESVVLEYTGLCHPCSQMEVAFGPGGYNAMRGHGGITAKVIKGGTIHSGDTVGMIDVEISS